MPVLGLVASFLQLQQVMLQLLGSAHERARPHTISSSLYLCTHIPYPKACAPSATIVDVTCTRTTSQARLAAWFFLQVESLLQRSPALDVAIAGSKYIFHVASPFRFDGDPQKGEQLTLLHDWRFAHQPTACLPGCPPARLPHAGSPAIGQEKIALLQHNCTPACDLSRKPTGFWRVEKARHWPLVYAISKLQSPAPLSSPPTSHTSNFKIGNRQT